MEKIREIFDRARRILAQTGGDGSPRLAVRFSRKRLCRPYRPKLLRKQGKQGQQPRVHAQRMYNDPNTYTTGFATKARKKTDKLRKRLV